MNFLEVTVESIACDTIARRLTSGQTLTAMSARDPVVGAAGHVSIRPENLTLTGAGGDASLTGVVWQFSVASYDQFFFDFFFSRAAWLFLVTIPYWLNLLIRTISMKFLIRDSGPINEWLLHFAVIDTPNTMINTDFAVQLGLFCSYLPLMAPGILSGF